MTVAVMLVWAALEAATSIGGLLQPWSPAVGGSIASWGLVLWLPSEMVAVVWVVRHRAHWPRLDPNLLPALLGDEQPIAVVPVRVGGTQPWRPALIFSLVGLSGLLGIIALSQGPALALVFLPFALLLVPLNMLVLAISNGLAERSARRGRSHSTARRMPPSRGRPPDWLVLTDRRVIIVGNGRGAKAGLIWHVPRTELVGVEAARRSWRTLDRTIRLHFADGSSVRLSAPDARPLLASAG